MLIHTQHLRLLTCEAAHLEAIVRNPKSLGELLGVSIPEGWPAFPAAYPHALALLNEEPLRPYSGWWLYLFTSPRDEALVGCGGFNGPPDVDGVVEIGCEIAPAYSGRGLGVEGMKGLIGYAFTRPEVSAVDTYSVPGNSASAAALEAVGMTRAGNAVDATAGKVWRWRITPDAFCQSVRRAA